MLNICLSRSKYPLGSNLGGAGDRGGDWGLGWGLGCRVGTGVEGHFQTGTTFYDIYNVFICQGIL